MKHACACDRLVSLVSTIVGTLAVAFLVLSLVGFVPLLAGEHQGLAPGACALACFAGAACVSARRRRSRNDSLPS